MMNTDTESYLKALRSYYFTNKFTDMNLEQDSVHSSASGSLYNNLLKVEENAVEQASPESCAAQETNNFEQAPINPLSIIKNNFGDAACESIVTMTIDVDHKQHSHFIGNLGVKVKRIIKMTGCKIQFPSNRGSFKNKSNSVTLTGTVQKVEQARSFIRLQTQLVLSFPIPYLTVNQSNELIIRQQFVDLQSDYKVKVAFYCNTVNEKAYCRVFGTDENEVNVVKAVLELMGVFYHSTENINSQTKLFLPTTTQNFVFLKRRSPPKILETYTRTNMIICSNNNECAELANAVDKTLIKVEGSPANVLVSRKLIKALLPIELKFEVPEHKFCNTKISAIAHSHISVQVQKVPKNQSYLVILKCSEYYADELYAAYENLIDVARPQHVFGFNSNEKIVKFFMYHVEPRLQGTNK